MSSAIHTSLKEAIRLHRAGMRDAARRLYLEVLDRAPNQADALHMLGVLELELGDTAAAEARLRAAYAMRPSPDTGFALAQIQATAGRHGEAAVLAREAAAKPATSVSLQLACARLLMQLDDWAGAVPILQRARGAMPKDAGIAEQLGACLHRLDRAGEAVDQYREALTLGADTTELHYNLALAESRLGHHEAALASVRHALSRKPELLEARLREAYLARLVCDWSVDETALVDAVAEAAEDGEGARVAPFILTLLPIDGALRRRIAEQHAAAVVDRVGRHDPPAAPQLDGPLRVGYLSPDFGNHAVGSLVSGLFAAHDRGLILPCCYSLRRHEDDQARAIEAGAERFRDLAGLAPAEAAGIIRGDGIHILVDMGGYTQGAVPEISARRPAPVQLSWLGYLDTMGADFIDGIVADEWTIPESEEAHYRESVLRLPFSPLPPGDGQAGVRAPGRDSLGLPDDAVVLASFNNPVKLNAGLFDAWLSVLEVSPRAVLWLYAGGMKEIETRLRERATQRGLDRRLVFAPPVAPDAHRARLQQADLLLDTPGYNGGATTLGALHAGVPVLTHAGRGILGRMASGLNRALGQDKLITDSLSGYRDRAVALATDPDGLRAAREALAAERRRGVLDQAAFVAGLERMLQDAWKAFG
jgi:protein O-GlcNAc transferase